MELGTTQFALDVQGLDDLGRQARQDPKAAVSEAARQFEALMLHQMLKSMREAGPRSELMDSEALRFHESLMDQQLAQHLAGRGLGLADQLSEQLLQSMEGVVEAQDLPPAADNN